MKHLGIVSYNIYGNFTNYGSALQSWALHKTINKLGAGRYDSLLIDYCPYAHLDKDILNPMKNMWDQDKESLESCELSMPDIRDNYEKFCNFYNERFKKTKTSYTYLNFEDINDIDGIEKFVCGSDTIFCTLEFQGFDDGYFANYSCMKGNSISYAASFGDATFDEETYPILNKRLQNFKALGIRENKFVSYIKMHVSAPCQKTIDPTLLLPPKEYDALAVNRLLDEKYILLYARRYNKRMFDFADRMAKEKGFKVVDISLRARKFEDMHEPWYKAGVEEFLSLIKYAEFVVTNSYHGLIFSVQYCKPFVVFTREQASNKIEELLDLFDLKEQMLISGDESYLELINYPDVHARIDKAREESKNFLRESIEILLQS